MASLNPCMKDSIVYSLIYNCVEVRLRNHNFNIFLCPNLSVLFNFELEEILVPVFQAFQTLTTNDFTNGISWIFSQYFFGMKSSISEDNISDEISNFGQIIFSKSISWSLILAFIEFGNELALYCAEQISMGAVGKTVTSITSFISIHLLPWIEENGSWIQFTHYISGTSSMENLVMVTGLMAFLTISSCCTQGVKRNKFSRARCECGKQIPRKRRRGKRTNVNRRKMKEIENAKKTSFPTC